MMAEKAWKVFERRVAAIFGGQRRGAQTSTNRRGKTDVIGAPGWAIECKLYKDPDYDVLLGAARQAEKNRESPTDIPIGVVKRLGGHDSNALVVMRLETFQEYFVNEPATEPNLESRGK